MQFLQGKLLVKISMKALQKVADSLLVLTVPDEKTIPFTAGQLSMTLGRYTLQRLSRLEVKAGKGRFILPSKSQLLLSGVNKTSFIDVQVSIPALQANFKPSSHISCFAFDVFNSGTWAAKENRIMRSKWPRQCYLFFVVFQIYFQFYFEPNLW